MRVPDCQARRVRSVTVSPGGLSGGGAAGEVVQSGLQTAAAPADPAAFEEQRQLLRSVAAFDRASRVLGQLPVS
jgi:hypothetical protein